MKEFEWFSPFNIERLAFDAGDVIARVSRCNEEELKMLKDITNAYTEHYGELHKTDKVYHGFFAGRPLSDDGKNLVLVICDDGWFRIADEEKAVYLPTHPRETHNPISSDLSRH